MTTSSFWYEDVGLEKRPPLAGDAECDLVVVGSGIAGMSSAYEAARFGWKVIVVDRAETIGGNRRTTGGRTLPPTELVHPAARAMT